MTNPSGRTHCRSPRTRRGRRRCATPAAIAVATVAGLAAPGAAPPAQANDSTTVCVRDARPIEVDTVRLARGTGVEGESRALAVDHRGRIVVADVTNGRLVRIVPPEWEPPEDFDGFRAPSGPPGEEFSQPPTPGFYPVAVAVRGFFVLALDATTRRILRFDDRGGYRDVLLDLEDAAPDGRISPVDIAVDDAGRLAVSDADGDRVLVFDPWLQLETIVGGPGREPGRLVDPAGVALLRDGGIAVVDRGAARVERFDDRGAFIGCLLDERDGLREPAGIATGPAGRVFVADPAAHRVFVVEPDGRRRALARVPCFGCRFRPVDVAVAPDGSVWVAPGAVSLVEVDEDRPR